MLWKKSKHAVAKTGKEQKKETAQKELRGTKDDTKNDTLCLGLDQEHRFFSWEYKSWRGSQKSLYWNRKSVVQFLKVQAADLRILPCFKIRGTKLHFIFMKCPRPLAYGVVTIKLSSVEWNKMWRRLVIDSQISYLHRGRRLCDSQLLLVC